MSVVVDNNFSKDTYGMRTERLIAIQGNFASIQPVLAAPAEIATWAVDCMDIFTDLLAVSNVEKNESESATMEVEEFEVLLEEEYQNARTLALAIFVDHPKLYEQFDFETVFPIRRNDKYNRVKSILTTYERFVADSTVPNLPSVVMTRLKNAMDGFDAALVKQDKERGESGMALAELSVCFEKDTKMLNKLKSWWFAMLGKKDPRITWVGMVNPQSGGGVSQITAPQNLRYETDYMKVVWDAVENATSYSLEVSNDGLNFTELTTTSDPEFSYIPYDAHSWFRVRSRNANGYSEYSSTIDFWYYEPLPAPANFQAEIIPGHECRLSWELVHSATTYRVYISDVAFGEPEGQFLPFLNTGQLEYTTTITPGRRMYFKVTCFNPYQAESGFSNTSFVEVTGV